MQPMPKPYQSLPHSVNEVETGSVAMNTMPNAQPPSTTCHSNGSENSVLVPDGNWLSSSDSASVPRTTPSMVRHEPTLVTIRITAPMRQHSVLVSPNEPGMRPMNASIQFQLDIIAGV